MKSRHEEATRVLYSFPLALGADRICTTAWYQIDGAFRDGVAVTALPASIRRPLPAGVKVKCTLARGRVRLPHRLFSRRHFALLHDYLTARYLERFHDQFDVVHAWPLGSLKTLRIAAKLGIPTVLERCNANTRFAFEVVDAECRKLGVTLPPDHEHARNEAILAREEQEFDAAYRLLCPSDFVVKTFVDKGYPVAKLARHIYGYDEERFKPERTVRDDTRGITMLSVGVCAVRKGLHYALEAWVNSPASARGQFLIAGEFLENYREKLASYLSHPSVKVLGHRTDVPELMRKSDILVLPSIEEGFGLVCTEVIGSGCVPLVSDACTELCRHMQNSLVHRVGDVATLQRHIESLDSDRGLLAQLRAQGLASSGDLTWTAAGKWLHRVYEEAVQSFRCDRRESTVARRGV